MPDPKVAPPYSTKESQISTGAPEERLDASIHSYVFVLWKRKWLIAASIVFCLGISTFINVTQKPVFRASTEVVLQPKESDTSSSSVHPGNSIMQDPTFLLTQLRVIKGPQLAERILQKFSTGEERQLAADCFALKGNWAKKDAPFTEREQGFLVSMIRGFISAEQVERGARIIAISMTGYDAYGVKKMVDTAAETYIDLNYETQIDAFKKSFSVISKSLNEIREKIKAGEMALQKIIKELQLLDQFKVYGDKHPMVVSLQTDITGLSVKLRESTNDLEKMEISQRKDRFSLIVESHTDMKSLTDAEVDLQTMKPLLEQEVNTNKELYNSLFKKLQEVELSGSRNVWLDAKVIEKAAVPGRPIRPNKQMNLLLGLLLGGFIGTGLAYFLEYLDSSLRSLNDLRSYLKIFPLGMVPMVELPELEKQIDLAENPELTRTWWNTNDGTLPLYVAEAYRIIRTSLAFGSLDKTIKVLQVTSAVKGEGKTTTVCNLGISLAQAGIKTLLIDADMRRPSLHHILHIDDRNQGLSTILSGDPLLSAKDFVRPTTIANLYCMTAGVIPPNPAELLSSRRIKSMLDALKEEFDMILIDSPPVISVADSPIISSHVEGTILVSRAGFIPRHICLHAKHAVEAVNGRIIGGILNCVTSHQHSSYYGYGYYYGKGYGYSYYGSDEKQGGKRKKKRSAGAAPGKLEKLMMLKEPVIDMISSTVSNIISILKSGQPRK